MIITRAVNSARKFPDLTPEQIVERAYEQNPEWRDKKHCPNCNASMEIALYEPDVADALLLLTVAREVRRKVNEGQPFTQANLVHVPTLATTDAVRHRTTRCSYLNLLKQPENKRNTGNWLITNWGWAALRGEQVPRFVKYFRGKLIGRSEKKTTLEQMLRTNVEKLRRAAQRRNVQPPAHLADLESYNPSEWVGYGGTMGGMFGQNE